MMRIPRGGPRIVPLAGGVWSRQDGGNFGPDPEGGTGRSGRYRGILLSCAEVLVFVQGTSSGTMMFLSQNYRSVHNPPTVVYVNGIQFVGGPTGTTVHTQDGAELPVWYYTLTHGDLGTAFRTIHIP